MDKALLALCLPFILGLLVIGWLFYASAGGRKIELKIRGLGIVIDLDTAPSGVKAPSHNDNP